MGEGRKGVVRRKEGPKWEGRERERGKEKENKNKRTYTMPLPGH